MLQLFRPTEADANTPTPDPVDRERAMAAIRELLIALGEDPDREGLRDTPRRVADMYREVFGGRTDDVAGHLSRTFGEAHDGNVMLRGIEFSSMCEHHLLPFTGTADIAYLPQDRVVGLSKLARTVSAYARRPQVQERMTTQIADAIMQHLDARGVLVVVRAQHLCMKVRGVNQSSSSMLTTAARGSYRSDPALRASTLQLLRGS